MLTVRVAAGLELGSPTLVAEACAYQQAGADELFLWGSVTTDSGSGLADLRAELALPLTVACGPDQGAVEAVFEAGADRVVLPAHELELLELLAARHGRAAVSAALRVEERAPGDARYRIGREQGERSGRDPLQWARRAAEHGAGEIALSAVDRNGARSAPSSALTATLSAGIELPLCVGGLLGAEEFYEALAAGAAAVQTNALDARGENGISAAKLHLAELGIQVRP